MKKIFEIEQLTGEQDATPEREANLSEGFLKTALETYFSPEQFNVAMLPDAKVEIRGDVFVCPKCKIETRYPNIFCGLCGTRAKAKA